MVVHFSLERCETNEEAAKKAKSLFPQDHLSKIDSRLLLDLVREQERPDDKYEIYAVYDDKDCGYKYEPWACMEEMTYRNVHDALFYGLHRFVSHQGKRVGRIFKAEAVGAEVWVYAILFDTQEAENFLDELGW